MADQAKKFDIELDKGNQTSSNRLVAMLSAQAGKTNDPFMDEALGCVKILWKRAITLCRNKSDAEELVQDTLAHAVKKKHLYQPNSHMKAWLLKMMYHRFIGEQRKIRPRTDDFDFENNNILSVPAYQDSELIVQHIESCLAKLSPVFRQAIELIADEKLSHEEAAKRVGCAEGTMKTRLSRARAQLRILLAEANGPTCDIEVLPGKPATVRVKSQSLVS